MPDLQDVPVVDLRRGGRDPERGEALRAIGVLLCLVGFLQGSLDVGGHTEVRCTLRSGNISKRSVAPVVYGAPLRLSRSRRKEGVAVSDVDRRVGPGSAPKRADARRNERALLDAAAAVFVASGGGPVREIATEAGVGMGTIYRHFPSRADLIVAVYRHQVEACAEAGPALLASSATAYAALAEWIDLFVDFLVTKHGLAAALQSDDAVSRRSTRTSSTAWCPCAPGSSPPPPRLARSAPTWMPTN